MLQCAKDGHIKLNFPLRFAKFKSDVCLQMEDYQGPKRKANYSTVAS